MWVWWVTWWVTWVGDASNQRNDQFLCAHAHAALYSSARPASSQLTMNHTHGTLHNLATPLVTQTKPRPQTAFSLSVNREYTLQTFWRKLATIKLLCIQLKSTDKQKNSNHFYEQCSQALLLSCFKSTITRTCQSAYKENGYRTSNHVIYTHYMCLYHVVLEKVSRHKMLITPVLQLTELSRILRLYCVMPWLHVKWYYFEIILVFYFTCNHGLSL